MKKIILCFVVIFTFFSSQAQTSMALVGGIQGNATSPDFLIYPDTLKKVSSRKIGITLGLAATIPIEKGFFFHTGILYAARGSNWTQFYDTANLYASTINLTADKKVKKYSVTTKLNVNYIDFPLNIMYKYKLPKGKSSLCLGAGPELCLFYNGSTSSQTVSVSQDSIGASHVRTFFKESENNDLPVGTASGKYRVVHFAMNAFAGIEFNRVFFHLNYSRDLNEFYEEEGRKYRNKTLGIKIGIYLGPQGNNTAK